MYLGPEYWIYIGLIPWIFEICWLLGLRSCGLQLATDDD